MQQTLVRTLDLADIVVVTTPEEGEGAAAAAAGAAAGVHRGRGRGRRVTLTAAAVAMGGGVGAGREHAPPHGREIGCFEFQSTADRAVFQSLVADLRSGVYRSADRYQRRALLKRGPEGGGAWNETTQTQSENGQGLGLRHGNGRASQKLFAASIDAI